MAAGGGGGVRGGGWGGRFGCGDGRAGGCFGFDEFDLGVGVTGFLELGLDQVSVLGVVDQFEVVGELGIKANGEELVGEGNRMRLEQVASSKGADTAHRIQNRLPECAEVGVRSCGSRQWRGEVRDGVEGGRSLPGIHGGRGGGRWRRCSRLGRGLGGRGRRGRRSGVAQGLQLTEHGIEGHRLARFDGLEEGDFEQDAFGRGVPEFPFVVDEDFEDAGDGRRIGEGGLAGEGGGFGFGEAGLVHLGGGEVVEEQGAKVAEEFGEESGEVFAVAGEVFEESEDLAEAAGEQGLGEVEDLALGDEPEHGEHVVFLDVVATEADELIEGGLGVAHAAIGAAGDGVEGIRADLYGFEFRDPGEVLDDEGGGDAAEVEALAAGEDGGQDFFRFGGGEHEFGVGGRFFERFQEGVEGLLGQHVDFVNDIDLEPGSGRSVADGVAELADFLDAAIAGAVDFDDIEGTALGDLAAAGVVVLEIDFGTIGAIQALGEDAGDGGFAGAAGTAEEVSVGDSVLADGVGQGLGDVILADDVAEPLGSVFAGDDLVRHGV